MSAGKTQGRWALVTGGVLLFVVVWFVAVLVFSKGGPAGVTAFGLLVIFGLMLMFLSFEAADDEQRDQERIARNRKRRAWQLRRLAKQRRATEQETRG